MYRQVAIYYIIIYLNETIKNTSNRSITVPTVDNLNLKINQFYERFLCSTLYIVYYIEQVYNMYPYVQQS